MAYFSFRTSFPGRGDWWSEFYPRHLRTPVIRRGCQIEIPMEAIRIGDLLRADSADGIYWLFPVKEVEEISNVD